MVLVNLHFLLFVLVSYFKFFDAVSHFQQFHVICGGPNPHSLAPARAGQPSEGGAGKALHRAAQDACQDRRRGLLQTTGLENLVTHTINQL